MSNENTQEITNPGPDALDVRGRGDGEHPASPADTPEQLSRRKFLSQISLALGGVGAVVVATPIVTFIIGPLFSKTPDTWRAVGAVDSFPVGQTQEVSFEDASPLPWAGTTAKTASWLRREDTNTFTAFAVNCTHLGCPVSWVPGGQLFLCPCHGGVYYADGAVAAGPPPLPLYRYPTRIRDGQVEIQALGTPIPTE